MIPNYTHIFRTFIYLVFHFWQILNYIRARLEEEKCDELFCRYLLAINKNICEYTVSMST